MSRIAEIEAITAGVGRRNQLLVKVTDEAGRVGWGESGLSGREAAVTGAVGHIRAFLRGQEARRIGRIWQEVYRSQYFEGDRVLVAALSAIDIALHDLLGKTLEVPVHLLLGGAQRERVPTFASTRACGAEVMDDVRLLLAGGWECIRVPPALRDTGEVWQTRPSMAETARWLTEIRAEFGRGLVLGVDYHHRLSVGEAASFCQSMPEGTLDFLEEPIRDETPEAYAALRTMTNVPFAIGEEFASKWQARAYVERGLTQYMRLDLCNIGGFTEAMKVAGWCEAHYIDLMPHNPLGPVSTAATVHFCAAVPNLSWLETRQGPAEAFNAHDTTTFPVQVTLSGADYIVPEAPGLGVEVDEAALRASPPLASEPPHLRRPDGAVTNW